MRPEPQAFAQAWVAAWDAHDREAMLSPYADGIVFTSANSTCFTGDPTGWVQGKVALRDNWSQALATGRLNFALRGVYASPDGVAIRYFSSRTQAEAVEVVRFDAARLVIDSTAYYE